jgi:hypothetical protein
MSGIQKPMEKELKQWIICDKHDRGLIPGRWEFSSPPNLKRIWDLLSLIQEVPSQNLKLTDHSCLSNAEVCSGWRFTSALLIRLHCIVFRYKRKK